MSLPIQGSLEVSELRYRRVFETAQVGILLIEFDTGKILDANKYLIDLLGYSKNELLDRYLWDIGIFKDITASKDTFKELQAKKYSRYEDLPLETKDGKKIAVEFISNVYEVDNTKIIQCHIREITERKLKDKLLLETKETYDNIASMSPYAIIIHREGILEYVNPKGVSLFGANSEAEVIGQPIIRFVHPDFHDIFTNRLKNMTEVGSVAKPLSEVYLRLDGTPVQVEVVTTRLKHKGDNVFQSIIVDITERKKVDEELKRIDRMKTDFIAIASHELRTPLVGIKQGIEIVLDRTTGNITALQEKFLKIARHNVDQLKRLSDDLLNISKIESGKEDIKPQSVDIVRVAEEMISQIRPQAGEKKIDLVLTSKPEGSFRVLADPEKLNEIFINLISNAIKFTGESGKISIEIADKGGFGEVIVIDTGTGISKDDFPKLFKKFEQFNRGPGPGQKGTGLGLAITKGLVELQGGNIRVESEPGKGSRFSFTIPKQRCL